MRSRKTERGALLKTVCHGGSCPAVPAHLPRIREKARPFGRDEARPYNFSTEHERGFTLTEMLVTLGVMILAVSLAIPMLRTSRAGTRRSDAVNAVRAVLASARQSAVERRTAVAIEFVRDLTSVNRGDRMVIMDKTVGIGDPSRQIAGAIELPEFIKFQTWSPDWTLENGWQGDSADSADTFELLDGTTAPYPDIAYRPDGTAADVEGTTDIVLVDTVDNLTIVLRVLPATGLVVEARHLQNPGLLEDPVTNPRRRGWL